MARRKKAKPRRSRRKSRNSAKLRKALRVPERKDYSLLLLVVVAVVAVIAIVMSQPAAVTGQAYNVPSNMCDAYCPEGQSGVPMGAHGRMSFCRCVDDY